MARTKTLTETLEEVDRDVKLKHDLSGTCSVPRDQLTAEDVRKIHNINKQLEEFPDLLDNKLGVLALQNDFRGTRTGNEDFSNKLTGLSNEEIGIVGCMLGVESEGEYDVEMEDRIRGKGVDTTKRVEFKTMIPNLSFVVLKTTNPYYAPVSSVDLVSMGHIKDPR